MSLIRVSCWGDVVLSRAAGGRAWRSSRRERCDGRDCRLHPSNIPLCLDEDLDIDHLSDGERIWRSRGRRYGEEFKKEVVMTRAAKSRSNKTTASHKKYQPMNKIVETMRTMRMMMNASREQASSSLCVRQQRTRLRLRQNWTLTHRPAA